MMKRKQFERLITAIDAGDVSGSSISRAVVTLLMVSLLARKAVTDEDLAQMMGMLDQLAASTGKNRGRRDRAIRGKAFAAEIDAWKKALAAVSKSIRSTSAT